MNPKKNDLEDKSNAGDECCIRFEPSEFYDNKETDFKIIHWENKPFVKDGAHCWQVTRSLSMSTWSFYDIWPCDDDFTGAAANICVSIIKIIVFMSPLGLIKPSLEPLRKLITAPGQLCPMRKL